MKRTLYGGLLAASLVFGGCAAGTAPASDSVAAAKDGDIVIDHAFGQTVLDSVPVRVAAVGWDNEDTPLALGIVPVGTSKSAYGRLNAAGLPVWTEEAYEALGESSPVVFDDTDGLDYEAIAAAEPDVILASYSGLSQEEYDRLSKIAPVVAYPDKPWQTLWREQTEMNAAALGKAEEGKKLVADAEALIQEKLAGYPQLKDVNAAFLWVNPADLSSFYVYTPNDPRAAYLTDLGLQFPASVEKLAGKDDFSVSVSRENADLLDDVDLIVLYGNDETLSLLQSDALLSQIPAVKNGAVAVIDENSDLAGGATPSILSIPYNLDAYLELLADAASHIQ